MNRTRFITSRPFQVIELTKKCFKCYDCCIRQKVTIACIHVLRIMKRIHKLYKFTITRETSWKFHPLNSGFMFANEGEPIQKIILFLMLVWIFEIFFQEYLTRSKLLEYFFVLKNVLALFKWELRKAQALAPWAFDIPLTAHAKCGCKCLYWKQFRLERCGCSSEILFKYAFFNATFRKMRQKRLWNVEFVIKTANAFGVIWCRKQKKQMT